MGLYRQGKSRPSATLPTTNLMDWPGIELGPPLWEASVRTEIGNYIQFSILHSFCVQLLPTYCIVVDTWDNPAWKNNISIRKSKWKKPFCGLRGTRNNNIDKDFIKKNWCVQVSGSTKDVKIRGLSPCDFDLIPKMKEPLRGIRFRTVPEILQAADRSIPTINTTGAAKGILRLPHRWQRVVHNAGDYIEGQ